MKKTTLIFIGFFIILFSEETTAQWLQLGPDGGTIEYVWGNNQFTFVACPNSGLFRSSNMGLSFSKVNLSVIGRYNFRSFTGNGNYLICQPNTSDGLYRSSNNGDSWISANNGLPTNSVSNFLTYNNFTLYNIISASGSGSGLYKSTNNGENWMAVNLSIGIDYLGFSGNNLIGHGGNGMILSTDGGYNWTVINNGLPQSYSSYRAIASNSTTVFIGVDSNNTGIGIYKTSDNGQNWIASNNGLANLNIYTIYTNNTTIYSGTAKGIFKSVDNGNSWNAVNNGLLLTRCGAVSSSGSNIISGFGSEYTQGGFYYSSNSGNSWVGNNAGINSQFVVDLNAKNDTLFAAINGSGIWKSNNNGNSWQKVNNGLPFTDTSSIRFIDYRSLGNDGQNIFCIIRSPNSIYKTTNDGNNWTYASSGITSSVNCIGTNNNLVYAGTSQGLFVTSNSGSNWSSLGLNRSIYGIDFSSSVIYACGNGVFQSTNNGVSWDTISGNISGGREIKVFGQNLYVVQYGYGVHKRSISGGSWVPVNNGITNLGVEKIHIADQYLIVTTHGENDLFVSIDEGASWTNKNQGIHTWINSFASIGNNVFIGTYGASVYRRPLSEIIGIQNINTEIPEGYSLSQNYPNPFNPTTNIEFSLPEKSFVKLKVFDITGKEVAQLVNENLSAGTFRYEFKAENLPSGLYFYKLESEKLSETKRMILIK